LSPPSFGNTFWGFTDSADINFLVAHSPPYLVTDSGAGPSPTFQSLVKAAGGKISLLAYIDCSYCQSLNTDGVANQFYVAAQQYNDETMFLHLASVANGGTGDGTITLANRKINPFSIPWWGSTEYMFDPKNLNVQDLYRRNIVNVLTNHKWLWNPDPSRGGLPAGTDGYDDFGVNPDGPWLDDFGNTFGNLNAQRGGPTVEYGTTNSAAWDAARISFLQAIWNAVTAIPSTNPLLPYTTKLLFANTLRLQNDLAWTAAVYQYAHGHMSEWQDTIVAQYSAAEFFDSMLKTTMPGVPVGKVFELSDYQSSLSGASGGPDNAGVYWGNIDLARRRRLQIAMQMLRPTQTNGIVTISLDGYGTPSTMFFPAWY